MPPFSTNGTKGLNGSEIQSLIRFIRTCADMNGCEVESLVQLLLELQVSQSNAKYT
jgi:hypothetical protein